MDTTFQNKSSPPSVKERFSQKSQQELSESPGEWFKRQAGQHAARGLETIVGLPGGFKKAFIQSRDLIANMLGVEPPSSMQKPEESNLFFNPPIPSELQEKATPEVAKFLGLDKDYFEPRGKKEKAAGEFTQDLTSFFIPGTGQMRLMTRIGAPIVGNLMKHGLEYFGVGEDKANQAKVGTMMAFSLANQGQAQQFAGNQISQAKQMIPQNATVNASNLGTQLIGILSRLQRGLRVPSKSKTVQGIENLIDQVDPNTSRISLHSLMDARDNVNEWISEAGGWDVPIPVRDATLRNLNQFKRSIIETIDQNMNSRFPVAADMYQNGYQAAAIAHRSNAISNFIERNFGKSFASTGAKILFPGIAAGGAAILPKTATIAAGTVPIYMLGRTLYRIGNSPTLATYYGNVMNEAIRGNAPAMIKNLIKLDKELAKDEKKEKKGKPVSKEEFRKKLMKKD